MIGYRALCIRLYFRATDPDGGDFEAWHDPEQWELSEDYVQNCILKSQAREALCAELQPFTVHFASIGCIRADGSAARVFNGKPDEEDREQTFYLIFQANDDVAEHAKQLAELRPDRVGLPAPLSDCDISADAVEVDATSVFDVLAQSGAGQDIGIWSGANTPDLLPQPGEEQAAWLERVALPSNAVSRLLKRHERAGGLIDLFGMVGAADERSTGNEPIEWLVPGLIPSGALTLFVGEHGTEKSTLLNELAAVIDSGSDEPRFFLGTEVHARGVSVFVTGEDAENIVNERAAYFEGEHGPANSFVIDGRGKSLDDILRLISHIPKIALLVIEPLAAFLEGRETDNSDLSEFYNKLNSVVLARGCAVVMAHHIKKGKIHSLIEIPNATRGGGLSVDRARMVIGMLSRRGDVTEIGIVKQNFPPSQMLWAPMNHGRLFKKNAETLRLDPIKIEDRQQTALSGEVRIVDRIFDALSRAITEGRVVRRTGRSELWEMKLPEVADLSRGRIRNDIAALIGMGRVTDGPEGLKIVAQASATNEIADRAV